MKTAFFLTIKTFWREIFCLKNSLADFFLESEQRKTLISAEKLRQDCQNCVLRAQKDNLTKIFPYRIKTFPIKLAFSAKKVYFLIFSWNLIFIVQARLRTEIELLKIYRFFIIFGFWAEANLSSANFFSAIVSKLPSFVQLTFKWKPFWWNVYFCSFFALLAEKTWLQQKLYRKERQNCLFRVKSNFSQNIVSLEKLTIFRSISAFIR